MEGREAEGKENNSRGQGRGLVLLSGGGGHGAAHIADLLVGDVSLELVKVDNTDDLGHKVEHDRGRKAVENGQHQHDPGRKWLVGCLQDEHDCDDHTAQEQQVEQLLVVFIIIIIMVVRSQYHKQKEKKKKQTERVWTLFSE